ncbi:hypothetical protein H6802_02770 [Candidatus Nomurabacteria bacterium]|nr:hypothetical protein [Candidatus Nomurabacteria bacterium]MCB9827162.1 hypothetical protein [Candidatus Nomurabacteria bacterium]MCB9827797.1 hypothetical protein [Candidatus Nomurabacteria bacterium]HXK52620.1 hypothetical protein [bacterium]
MGNGGEDGNFFLEPGSLRRGEVEKTYTTQEVFSACTRRPRPEAVSLIDDIVRAGSGADGGKSWTFLYWSEDRYGRKRSGRFYAQALGEGEKPIATLITAWEPNTMLVLPRPSGPVFISGLGEVGELLAGSVYTVTPENRGLFPYILGKHQLYRYLGAIADFTGNKTPAPFLEEELLLELHQNTLEDVRRADAPCRKSKAKRSWFGLLTDQFLDGFAANPTKPECGVTTATAYAAARSLLPLDYFLGRGGDGFEFCLPRYDLETRRQFIVDAYRFNVARQQRELIQSFAYADMWRD